VTLRDERGRVADDGGFTRPLWSVGASTRQSTEEEPLGRGATPSRRGAKAKEKGTRAPTFARKGSSTARSFVDHCVHPSSIDRSRSRTGTDSGRARKLCPLRAFRSCFSIRDRCAIGCTRASYSSLSLSLSSLVQCAADPREINGRRVSQGWYPR